MFFCFTFEISTSTNFRFDILSQQRRNAGKWYPDAEFLQQFSTPVLYPTDEQKWMKPILSGELLREKKKTVAKLIGIVAAIVSIYVRELTHGRHLRRLQYDLIHFRLGFLFSNRT